VVEGAFNDRAFVVRIPMAKSEHGIAAAPRQSVGAIGGGYGRFRSSIA
jgi:hypothetical protein